MHVNLQWATENAEHQIAYIARGSNPPNQDNPEYEKLLRYCLKHDHWSPFQMANLCLHFETSLAIAAQVKRHWSIAICEPADIQETSMRYMDPFEHKWGFQPIEMRKTAKTNRQSSEELLQGEEYEKVFAALERWSAVTYTTRDVLKEAGVSNETMRMIYPQATTTRFFLNGSCRSWIHYFQQRLDEHAQLEHRQLAQQAYEIFKTIFPTVAGILQLDQS